MSLDHTAAQLALRARLSTLAAVSTGTTTLTATATGFTRDTGSFLDDGFAPGMELAPTGFADQRYAVVDTVSALTLTVTQTDRVAQVGVTGALTVGLPELCGWDNVRLEPQGGRPYIEESYVPATAAMLSGPYAGGTKEDTGLYVIRWYGLAERGLSALTTPTSALLDLFKPGTDVAVEDGVTLRVRGDIGPTRGPVLADLPGWVVITVTIPWRVYHTN